MSLPREGAPDITIPYVFVTAPLRGHGAVGDREPRHHPPREEAQRPGERQGDHVHVRRGRGHRRDRVHGRGEPEQRAPAGEGQDRPGAAGSAARTWTSRSWRSSTSAPTCPILTLALSGRSGPRAAEEAGRGPAGPDRERCRASSRRTIFGAREREIRVEIDPARLAAYGVPLGAVMRRRRAGELDRVGRQPRDDRRQVPGADPRRVQAGLARCGRSW